MLVPSDAQWDMSGREAIPLHSGVALLDTRQRVLPFLDGEIASILMQRMSRLGIRILLGEPTEAVEVRSGSVSTSRRSGQVLEMEKLLFAAGRGGNTAGPGLDRIGIATDAGGRVPVSEHYPGDLIHRRA